MCGITAFLSKNKEAIKYLLNGLTILQNRGYDSAGICTLNEFNELINNKFASTCDQTSLDLLHTVKSDHANHHIGIAHTRWATHGPKTDNNAHPHTDYHNKISLVHNGIIENYKELKRKLINHGYKFVSDTDTEVIVNLISYYMESNDIMKSINLATNDMEGTWGVVILFKEDPDHLYVCKNGSPLLIAYGDDFVIIASESSAFSQYTNQYVTLKDNDIIKLSVDNNEQFIEFQKIENTEEIKLSPEPYSHWMLKEICDQSDTTLRAINMGGRIDPNNKVRLGGLTKHREELMKIENLLIIASGTSYHSGLLAAKYMKQFKCFNTVSVIDSAEFVVNDIPFHNPGILAISQSGETKDVHYALEMARERDVIIIGIVNVVGSLIARESDCGVYLNAGREVAVASTKAFTSQVVVLALLTLWFSQNKKFELKSFQLKMINDIRNLSVNFKKIINNLPTLIDDNLVSYISDKHSLFVLGRGNAYPIACECALKIKEIAYIHAEGYAGGALKHGPFALLEAGMPIILIILDDEYKEKMISACEEVRARGVYTIIVTDICNFDTTLCDYKIQIPSGGNTTALMAIVPIQYLSYKIALKKGHNPDFPKNLSKTITVL